MKRKNIFIGFNNEMGRCLLYKLDSNSFIDLESNKVYKVDDLLETTILPYERFIKLKGLSSKRKIKKEYQVDANKSISVDDLFIGELGEVTRIYNYKESKSRVNLGPYMQAISLYCGMPLMNELYYVPEHISYEYSYKVVAKDVLLQRIKNKYDDPDYVCLLSNTRIPHNNGRLEVGDVVVGSIKPFKEKIDVNEKLLPKNKVMELHMINKTK